MFDKDFIPPKYGLQSPSKVKSMEPMNVGSPSTPNSTSRQYLPGFLMGDSPTSPTHGFTSPLQKPQPKPPTPHSGKVLQPRLSGMKTASNERSNRRHDSPPIQGLWNVDSNGRRTDSSDKNLQNSLSHTPNASVVNGPKFSSPFFSPQQTPFNKSLKESQPDDESATWVTVFGYEQSQAKLVLQQFGRLGTIEKYSITNGGNWMNIKYANKIQARCALNRNGRVLDGKFMIGVRRCTDLSTINSSDLVSSTPGLLSDGFDLSESAEPFSRSAFKSPAPWTSDSPLARGGSQAATAFVTDSPGLNTSRNDVGLVNRSFSGGVGSSGPLRSGVGLSRHNSMRPLAVPYQPPPKLQAARASRYQSFRASNSNSTGLFSKALDYMFGWN